MKILIKAINKVFSNFYALIDHEGYARWRGVNM